MSKLKELIDRLCPDGVEYKSLGEVGIFIRGNGLQKKDFTESGVGCIHYGQIYTHYGTYTKKTKSFVSEELAEKLLQVFPGNLIIACTSENVEDVGKAVAWLGKENIVTGGHSVVYRHTLNPKFVSYFFQTENFFVQKKKYSFGAKVIDIKASDLAKIIIPVPPLEVQEEIVRILDTFSAHAAELQAELQTRKEQYEYYRNLLLTFNPYACGCGTDGEQEIKDVTPWGGASYEIEWKTMGEICIKISSGGTPSTSKKSYYHGNIPWMRTQEVDWKDVYDTDIKITEEAVNNSSAKMIPANCVIIAMYGATAAKCCINKIPLTTNQACCNLQINPQIANYRYVYQWICKEYENLKGMGEGSQKNINVYKIKNYKIPIPPLEVQEKIVSILDRFETLVNDLTQGLPAEIAAVKERYEYYRNQLLTFKPIA